MKKLILLMTALIIVSFLPLSVGANELATGKTAKSSGAIQIPVVSVSKLNGITMEQLYKMRTDAVERYKKLLGDTYEPNDAIFGMCESKKPWWGVWGMQLYREGERSIEGPAKESVYILNPFRLVAAEATNVGLWNPKLVTKEDMQNPDFPFLWKSGPVTFNPSKATAEVSYDISKYNDSLKQWKNKRLANKDVSGFSLIAYNARDFNYSHIYLDPQKSFGVKPWATNKSVAITQMLHCGGSCGYPGGCNNMSPFIAEMDYNTLSKLPARAYLKLWKEEPSKVEQPADFTFIINFN